MFVGSYYNISLLNLNPIAPVYNFPTESTEISSIKLLELINKERALKDLPPFEENNTLSYIAYLRATDILENQEFSHEATRSGLKYNTIAKKVGYPYKEIKENLALGFNSEEEIIDAWKKSKKHAENLFAAGNYNVGMYSKKGIFNGKDKIVTVLILGIEN